MGGRLVACFSCDLQVFLLFGKGWIGSDLGELLKKNGETFTIAESRMENRESVVKEIEKVMGGVWEWVSVCHVR